MAAPSNRPCNFLTCLPSVVVASGKNKTGISCFKNAAICSRIRAESPEPRLINKVPPPFAKLPKMGHFSTSALAKKKIRAPEPKTATSSHDTWLLTHNAGARGILPCTCTSRLNTSHKRRQTYCT